jgi:Cft2 family RNA processing exonuclease
VHITSTPIWCDARRRRDVCFVSAADALQRGVHGQLIGTPTTLALLASKGDGDLAVPVRQRFTLGTVRLQLIPSGHGLGGAALLADIAGKTVLYAGAVRTTVGGLGEPAEVRKADAVVVAAPFGDVGHAFPPLARVMDQTAAWSKAQLAAQRRPVLFVDGLLDALEVAASLVARGIAVATSKTIRDAAARANDLRIPALGGVAKEPRAIVWLDSDHAGLKRAIGKRHFATALASGRALAEAKVIAAGYDAAFAWATAADRAQLLAWIDATSAKQIFVTGACADAIASAIGPRARVMGPPHQMTLFG